jgi:hypothetical protein
METRYDKKWDAEVREHSNKGRSHIIDFAVKWADEMEAKMASGARIGAIAKSTALEVNPVILPDGVDVLNDAINLLEKYWVHGGKLHQWRMVIMEYAGHPLMVRLVCWRRRI